MLKTRLFLFTSLALLVAAFALSAADKPPSVRAKHTGITRAPLPAQRTPRATLDEIYMSTDVPHSIPDGGSVTSELVIAADSLIRDVNVLVTITHTWVRDLRIILVPPQGPEIILLEYLPLDSAVNMTGTVFDDEAELHIYQGIPPFSDFYRPLQPLSVLDSSRSAGTWRLRVEDVFPADTGSIVAWGVEINPSVNLEGTLVHQRTRRPVPGSGVLVTHPDRSTRSTRTDFNGHWSFTNLSPDTYTVRFGAHEYDSLIVPGVVIQTGVPVVLDTSLRSDFDFYTFQTTDPPEAITDGNSTIKEIEVPEIGAIVDVDVMVNITHTAIGDLGIFLQAPAGALDTLLILAPDFDHYVPRGSNMLGCWFDDEAATPISQGIGPFTGRFRPAYPLTLFDTLGAAGTWSMEVIDGFSEDQGTFDNFTLSFKTNPLSAEPPVVTRPQSFTFHPNYPNPFNAATRFRFDLSRTAQVKLVLFDVAGRQVPTLLDEVRAAGSYTVPFDAAGLASGLYFARMRAGTESQFQKVMLIR